MADEGRIKAFPQGGPARDNIWLVIVEFVIVAGLFVADVYHHIFFSKTPYLFLLGWVSLRLRGLRWKDVGLSRPRNWAAAVGLGILGGICIGGIELFVTQPLLVRLIGKMPDLSDFTAVHGNLKLTLFYLLLTWTLAAFGEEMVYRGYLMNRVAGLFSGTQAGWIASRDQRSLRMLPHRSRQHGHDRECVGRTPAWRSLSGLRTQPGGADHRARGDGYGGYPADVCR